MPIIIGETKSQGVGTPYYQRKIRCPGHWLVSPKVDVYLREPVPELKDCRNYGEYQGQRIKIQKMRIKKDRFGRKMIDWKKLYELRKTGQVLNPLISASFAIEHVYDPLSVLCLMCDKRCMEGKGKINERSIKRLNGG